MYWCNNAIDIRMFQKLYIAVAVETYFLIINNIQWDEIFLIYFLIVDEMPAVLFPNDIYPNMNFDESSTNQG